MYNITETVLFIIDDFTCARSSQPIRGTLRNLTLINLYYLVVLTSPVKHFDSFQATLFKKSINRI